ncbi:MAG: glycosyl transferase family 28 [Planctomycetes bacterium]|nr:glycosyl transferase family 28 [Planctomycetota bacterium]
MIFLTVGTLFPFNRLVLAVDKVVTEGLLEENIIAQVGKGGTKGQNIKCVEVLGKDKFDKYVKNASCLISHAGIGSITTALRHNKPLLVMPRLKRYGEHVNDHQLGTARKFEKLGHILVAYSEKELPEKLEELKSFVPQPRKTQAEAVINRISKFLNEL